MTPERKLLLEDLARLDAAREDAETSLRDLRQVLAYMEAAEKSAERKLKRALARCAEFVEAHPDL